MEFQSAIHLSDGKQGLGSLGHLYAEMGKETEANIQLQALAEKSKDSHVSPYESAVICAGLGNRDKALEQIEKSYAARSQSAPALRLDPRLRNLRQEPRFRDLETECRTEILNCRDPRGSAELYAYSRAKRCNLASARCS
jgi:hypothetical protein